MDYALKLILKQINQKLVCRVDGKEYCYENGDAAIAELEKDDVKKVIRVISIIPNILFEFYKDLVKYLA